MIMMNLFYSLCQTMLLLNFDRLLSFCSGVPSPKFTVRTPAKREHHRILKKRKNFFDETIVLSNEYVLS